MFQPTFKISECNNFGVNAYILMMCIQKKYVYVLSKMPKKIQVKI